MQLNTKNKLGIFKRIDSWMNRHVQIEPIIAGVLMFLVDWLVTHESWIDALDPAVFFALFLEIFRVLGQLNRRQSPEKKQKSIQPEEANNRIIV